MDSTLVIAYGTGSRNLAKRYSNGKHPIVLMDKKNFDDSGAPGETCIHVGEDIESSLREVCGLMSGYTYAVLIFSPSSVSGQEIYEGIIKCASNAKTKLIVFCIFPFSFETEKLDRAASFITDFGSDTGNIFVFDYQKTVDMEHSPVNYNVFLESTNDLAAQIFGTIIDLLESSPFFSYCSDPVYTMAVGTGQVLNESIIDALAHPFFDTYPGCGKILILSDREPDEAERESAVQLLTLKANAMPEFAGRSGLGEDKVLLFIPTSFRPHE